MHVRTTVILAASLAFIGACSRVDGDGPSSVDVQPVPQPEASVRALAPPASFPRSPGQPRLSALLASPQDAPPETNRSPVATYSRYAGRAPTDAVVPRGIADVGPAPKQTAKPPAPTQRREQVAYAAPQRAEPTTRPSPAPRTPAARPVAPINAITRAPRPVPRPITASPTPSLRPALESPIVVAAPQPTPVLPPRPVIAGLRSPALSAPRAISDTTPTGLPALTVPEQAIPLGTLPASLGVANIQASEAALPVADTLEKSNATEDGTLGWTQAASLIRAGEVETTTDIGEFEVLLTLCSGRGVISIQPTPTALADIEKPKVICGKTVPLTSQ